MVLLLGRSADREKPKAKEQNFPPGQLSGRISGASLNIIHSALCAELNGKLLDSSFNWTQDALSGTVITKENLSIDIWPVFSLTMNPGIAIFML
jgi:hypothetical protein